MTNESREFDSNGAAKQSDNETKAHHEETAESDPVKPADANQLSVDTAIDEDTVRSVSPEGAPD